MLNIIATIIVSIATAAASLWGFYNHAPLSILETGKPTKTLGSAITTIQGSDTLSSSRAVINTNFANLNADKVELSNYLATTTATQFTTFGTIATGIWNGTAIGVPYGGTGSTTLSSNQLLLGNGTGILKTVSGFGNSGYSLISNGAGLAPTWQSVGVDQSQAYTWSGGHIFQASTTLSATTTIAANSTTTKALVLNNIPYKFPSTQGASSTALMTDGGGGLSWELPYGSFASGQIAVGDNTSTLTIPHGLGRTPGLIVLHYAYAQVSSSNSLTTGTGSGTSTASFSTTWSNTAVAVGSIGQSNTLIMIARDSVPSTIGSWTLTTLDSTNIILTQTLKPNYGNNWLIQWEAYR